MRTVNFLMQVFCSWISTSIQQISLASRIPIALSLTFAGGPLISHSFAIYSCTNQLFCLPVLYCTLYSTSSSFWSYRVSGGGEIIWSVQAKRIRANRSVHDRFLLETYSAPENSLIHSNTYLPSCSDRICRLQVDLKFLMSSLTYGDSVCSPIYTFAKHSVPSYSGHWSQIQLRISLGYISNS